MRELTMNEMTAVFGGTEGTWEHRKDRNKD